MNVIIDTNSLSFYLFFFFISIVKMYITLTLENKTKKKKIKLLTRGNVYIVLYNRYSYWIIIHCYYFLEDVSKSLKYRHKVNKYNKNNNNNNNNNNKVT